MTRNPLPNRNPILAFDSQQLARIHDAAKDRAIRLRQAEIKAFRNRIFAVLQSGLRRLGLR
ncbi:MAG: hypothetical protein KAX99_04145 [Azonexus sp.]|nr:hypothetical protein [Azonexus sp.]